MAKMLIVIMVMGSDIIAIGKACFVFISTTIHNIDPIQKEPYPMSKQRKVPLDLSNLLRQEIKRPGKMMLVTGNQAHFRQNYGVIDGNTITKGLSNIWMTKLLYEVLRAQCTMRPAMIQIMSNENNMNIPFFNDLTLSILMQAMMVQTASTSLMIHIPSVSQQRPVRHMPISKETISRNRIADILAQLSLRFFSNHKDSDAQIVTPAVPIKLPTTWRVMLVMLGKQQARMEPTITTALKTPMKVLVTLMPNPLYDQALLQSEEAVMVMVQKHISMNSPHSKGLQNQDGLQLTKQSKLEYPANETTIQFIWFLPDPWHPFVMCATQFEDPVSSHWSSQVIGRYLLDTEFMCTPRVTI